MLHQGIIVWFEKVIYPLQVSSFACVIQGEMSYAYITWDKAHKVLSLRSWPKAFSVHHLSEIIVAFVPWIVSRTRACSLLTSVSYVSLGPFQSSPLTSHWMAWWEQFSKIVKLFKRLNFVKKVPNRLQVSLQATLKKTQIGPLDSGLSTAAKICSTDFFASLTRCVNVISCPGTKVIIKAFEKIAFWITRSIDCLVFFSKKRKENFFTLNENCTLKCDTTVSQLFKFPGKDDNGSTLWMWRSEQVKGVCRESREGKWVLYKWRQMCEITSCQISDGSEEDKAVPSTAYDSSFCPSWSPFHSAHRRGVVESFLKK